MNFKKPPVGGRARGWIRNIPESERLRFHCRQRNRGKGALRAAGNLTIDYLLCLEYRVPNIYIYVENVLRATQTRVIFNPAVPFCDFFVFKLGVPPSSDRAICSRYELVFSWWITYTYQSQNCNCSFRFQGTQMYDWISSKLKHI